MPKSNPIGTQEEILERLADFLDSLSTSEDNGFIRLRNGRIFGSREAYTHIVRGDDFAFKWEEPEEVVKCCNNCWKPTVEASVSRGISPLEACSCAKLVFRQVGAKTL